jgi:hypothetical protein
VANVHRMSAAAQELPREADDVALVERVELLEAENRELRQERERLKAEMMLAQAWVKELATWIETGVPIPSAVRDSTDRHDLLLRSGDTRSQPTDWWAVTVLIGAIVAPWLVAGLVTYVVARAL